MKTEVSNEMLIPYSEERLTQEMEKRPELKELLFTPVEKLTERTKYFLSGEAQETLYATIRKTEDYDSFAHSILFSDSTDNRLVGWVCYLEDLLKCSVLYLYMFAFQSDSAINMKLAEYLIGFVKDLLETHIYVYFIVVNENPANKEYEKAFNALKREGYGVTIVKKGNKISYHIQAKDVKDITEEVLKPCHR